MGLALGTGELFHQGAHLPHLCLGRAASASASYGLTLWAEPGGHCWGCSHIGLAPILQPFKLFVLQELFALQVPSLCPWGGAGTAVPSDSGHLMGLWLSRAVQFSQGHGISCRQHLSAGAWSLARKPLCPLQALLGVTSLGTAPQPCQLPSRAPEALPH